MGGLGAALGAAAGPGLAISTGSLEGQNAASQIAYQRQQAMMQFARQQALAESQESHNEALSDWLRGRNATSEDNAHTGADAKVAVAGANADARVNSATIGADGRVKVGAAHDLSQQTIGTARNASQQTIGTARNATAIQVANINAASRQAAAQLRVKLANSGAGGATALRAITLRGQALVAQYPDDAALSAAETGDPALHQALDQAGPDGVSLRDAYHVAQGVQSNKTQANAVHAFQAVPNAAAASAGLRSMGVNLPNGAAPPPPPAPPAPSSGLADAWATAKRSVMGGPQAGLVPALAPPGGPSLAPPTAPPAPPPPGVASLGMTPAPGPSPAPAPGPGAASGGAPKPVKTQQDMQQYLLKNPGTTPEAYQTVYTVLPGAAQATPGAGVAPGP